jgi:hypothetical protein
VVVPSFMDVVVNSEQVCPGCQVQRSLELKVS